MPRRLLAVPCSLLFLLGCAAPEGADEPAPPELTGGAQQALVVAGGVLAPSLPFSYKFGHAVVVDGNTMVVSDRGYKPSNPFISCGSIDDGAIHVYNRSSASAAWPAAPIQTIISHSREAHFGEHLFLRGNTLIVTEPRLNVNGTFGVGGFHVYTRVNAQSPFTLADTETRPAGAVSFFTDAGFAANARYMVAATVGAALDLYVYRLNGGSIQFLYRIPNSVAPLFRSELALTENDVLVMGRGNGSTGVGLFKLRDDGFSTIDASSLTLTNPPFETNRYFGLLAAHGTQVALAAQRQGALPPNIITYYLQTFDVANDRVDALQRIELPSAYTSSSNHQPATRGLAVRDNDALALNVSQTGGALTTLVFDFTASTGRYEYAGNVNMVDVHTLPGLGDNSNYGKPVTFDGSRIYISDTEDRSLPSDPLACSPPQGSVRIIAPAPTTAGAASGSVRLTDPFPATNAALGGQVALNGDFALVGAAADGDVASQSGAATLYRLFGGAWGVVKKYIDPQLQSGQAARFGTSVDLGEDFLAIGIPFGTTSDVGTVAVSRQSDSTFLSLLTASPNEALSEFGYDVAVSGNTVVVGAPGVGSAGTLGGSVHLFDWTGTAFSIGRRITASDAAAGDRFGHAVDIRGEHIFVGAPRDDNGEGADAGAVYVYRRSGTTITLVQKITASFQASGSLFGSAVSVADGRAVIGAPGHATSTGAAFAVRLVGTSWSAEGGTNPLPGAAGASFGSSVAVEGDNLLVGGPGDASTRGRVTRFQYFNSRWNSTASMTGPTAGRLGSGVAISGANGVLGAPGETFTSGSTVRTGAGAGYWINVFSIGGSF